MTIAREGASLADTRALLVTRAGAAGLLLPTDLTDRLLAYLELLAMWSRRINLTAFDLSAPTGEAIDRLLVEPVAAASLVRPGDRRAIDIGSGGGSPAVPFMLAVPAVEMVMVEVRAKKAAFLREVVRTLDLPATVEVARAEELALSGSLGVFDVVTLRAVRADRGLWQAVERLLAPGGRVLWFGGVGQSTESITSLATNYLAQYGLAVRPNPAELEGLSQRPDVAVIERLRQP